VGISTSLDIVRPRDHLKPGCNQPELTRRFLDILADNGLTQVVKEPTYYENTLDLLLMSNPSIVQKIQVTPGISSDGHHAIYAEVDISLSRQTNEPRKIHAYKGADWDGLKAHMGNFKESFMAETTTQTPVNELLQLFSDELLAAIDRFVPSKMTKTRERPPWIPPDTVRLLRKQRRLFEKQKGSARASRASQQYRSMKALTQRSIRKSYWEYIRGIIGDSGESGEREPFAVSKRFWNFIKHRRQDPQGVAPLRKEGTLVNDPVGKATMLNEQFQSAFTPKTPPPAEVSMQASPGRHRRRHKDAPYLDH
jgi:hypothetical protein